MFKVLLEQLAWTLALALVAILLYQEISSYFAFITDNPVVTSVSLRPAGEVAFPAVVVDAGDAVDPLGFVRASRNAGDEANVAKPGLHGNRLAKMIKSVDYGLKR